VVNPRDDAWLKLTELIAASPVNVVVCPPHENSATGTAPGLGTGSYLGALARNTSGILVDDGWLRLLGGSSGEDGLPGLDEAEQAVPMTELLGTYNDVAAQLGLGRGVPAAWA
jgi:hypothetical protein